MSNSEVLPPQAGEWADFAVERSNTNYPKWPNEVMVKMIFGSYLGESIKPQPNGKVLDVGCGFGNNLRPFLDMGCECHGIEIHPDMVKVANEVISGWGYEANVQTGSNRALPYEDNSFDLLISINALHYEGSEENIEAALHEFHRVLKPGGGLYISTVGPEHEIFQRARPLGHHRYRVQDWDFRDGQEFFFFDNENYLKLYCEKHFPHVEVGKVVENLMTLQVGFLTAACKK